MKFLEIFELTVIGAVPIFVGRSEFCHKPLLRASGSFQNQGKRGCLAFLTDRVVVVEIVLEDLHVGIGHQGLPSSGNRDWSSTNSPTRGTRCSGVAVLWTGSTTCAFLLIYVLHVNK